MVATVVEVETGGGINAPGLPPAIGLRLGTPRRGGGLYETRWALDPVQARALCQTIHDELIRMRE